MAELPKLGIVTLLNSMLDSSEKEQEGDKVGPIAEPLTLDDMTRDGFIVACGQSYGEPCVCGALVKCTSADGGCTIDEEYIEGKAWQGVDRTVGNVRHDPKMESKRDLVTGAVSLLPGVNVQDRKGTGQGKKQYALDVNESYMVCTYGNGLIYFADAGQMYVNTFLDEAEFMVEPDMEPDMEAPYEEPEETEQETGETKWIPSQVMQLNGTSVEEQKLNEYIYGSDSVDGLNQNITDEKLKWDQKKIDIVWDKCKAFYEEYGVQIDPRMMLAIVIAEGTGSFNTNSTDKAGDGGNGPQPNFEADCENAIDILGGKILAYLQYHEAFTEKVEEAAEKNLPGMEAIKEALQDPNNDAPVIDVLYYLNWKTPRLGFFNMEFKSGVYADNNRWSSEVRDIYSNLADFDAYRKTGKYTEYLTGLDPAIFSGVAADKGIDVNQPVEFRIVQNGMDSNRQPNGEYTVVGIIGS